MSGTDPQFHRAPAQFLADQATFLVRLANLAAFPYWEGVEILFTAMPDADADPPGIRLNARLRQGGNRLGERFFPLGELQDGTGLPAVVEGWVQSLPVP